MLCWAGSATAIPLSYNFISACLRYTDLNFDDNLYDIVNT